MHIATAFRLQHKHSNNIIYQLTSSAITYNVGRIGGAMLGLAPDDEGETREGNAYKRLALCKDANFSLIRVDPQTSKVEFKLYGRDAALEVDVDVPGARGTPARSTSNSEYRIGVLGAGHDITTNPQRPLLKKAVSGLFGAYRVYQILQLTQ